MPELKVNDLTAGYDGEEVLHGFSFDFSAKRAYALMGGSGVGKTTLLHVLAGLKQPEHGSIGDFEKLKCAVMFQEDRLLEHLSARQNVELVSDAQQAERWLKAVGLEDKSASRPSELSGGQRRRVALARCLAFGGRVLLLDEPFTGIDTELKGRIANELKDVFEYIILSTHDIEEARLLNATVVHLERK